jgi:hypothetical protein
MLDFRRRAPAAWVLEQVGRVVAGAAAREAAASAPADACATCG